MVKSDNGKKGMFYVESERMNKKGMGMLTEDIQKQWEGEIVEKEDGVEKVHGMEKKDGSCEGERQSCGCHQKTTPRSDEELKLLKNRLNRMTGQLNGIGKMLDENRYCGDVLNQVAAVESALKSFAYMVLQKHMETCVTEEIRKGNLSVVQETVELVKKLGR
jgi:DNA-binding FrmR family transcriptional regulator